jgi:hypothetical protein
MRPVDRVIAIRLPQYCAHDGERDRKGNILHIANVAPTNRHIGRLITSRSSEGVGFHLGRLRRLHLRTAQRESVVDHALGLKRIK